MTEIEKKAEKYAKECFPKDEFKQAMVEDGCLKFYEQGSIDSSVRNASVVHSYTSDLITARKENAELKDENTILTEELKKYESDYTQALAQIEKMKCCGNCGNTRCTSSYRGNSAYHRQKDGFACADNEDWIERS